MKNSDVEKVKAANAIEQVIGRYVRLTVKGYKATGLCPFHADHHPSLQVDMRKQTFVCYACGEKGDVIEFVRKKEGCSFPEALEKLGHSPVKNCPVREPAPAGRDSRRIREEHTKFLSQLMPYVSGHPELSPSYLDFEVGVAPMAGRHPMRGRVVFPIRDSWNALVGFSGREDSSRPTGAKYLNTPVSEGFYRSRILYGFHRAQKAMEQEGCLYLVEGYKDVIAMHAAGFTHTAGICGTELTDEQAHLFRTGVERVFLLMDGDEPGWKAAAKIREKLAPLPVEIIRLPEGHDPDSLFREMGKERFAAYIRHHSLMLYRWEYLLVTACLVWPEATICRDGGPAPFLSFLDDLFQGGEIAPFFRDHQRLIHALAEGTSLTGLPEELQRVARELTDTYRPELERMLPEWLEVQDGDAEKAIADLMQYLLFHYSESDLSGRMNRLTHRLQRSDHPEERNRLLQEIDNHRELIRFISEQLNRPAALKEEWLRIRERYERNSGC